VNSKERIDSAVNLEIPDRVPIAPLLDHFAATYTGISMAELMSDRSRRIGAVLETMEGLGPWDMSFAAETANETLLKWGMAAPLKTPGKELPSDEIHQFAETETLKVDDYDQLSEMGVSQFRSMVRRRLYPEITPESEPALLQQVLLDMRSDREEIEATGCEMAVGGFLQLPLEWLSLGRSMEEFIFDLHDRPEKVKDATRLLRDDGASMGIGMAEFVGVPRVFIGMSRSSPSFLSPALVEEFVWPDFEYITRAAIDAGLTVLLHCDTNWTRAYDLFKRLPPRSCILELDGDSDIFKAKEALGDHLCIMGDVPAYLLAFRGKDEVLAYCRRLIDEVGRGGGFILSSGCSIPANARVENVVALREAVDEWGRY
jgi:hypothetical protein